MSRKKKKGKNKFNFSDNNYNKYNNVNNANNSLEKKGSFVENGVEEPFIELKTEDSFEEKEEFNNESDNIDSLLEEEEKNSIFDEKIKEKFNRDTDFSKYVDELESSLEEEEKLDFASDESSIDNEENKDKSILYETGEIECLDFSNTSSIEVVGEEDSLRLVSDESEIVQEEEHSINNNYNVDSIEDENPELSNTNINLKSEYLQAKNYYSSFDNSGNDSLDSSVSEKTLPSKKNIGKKRGKVHFNFQFRIAILVCSILILLGISSVMVLKAVLSQETKNVGYSETTAASYNVCLKSADPYNVKCLDANGKYDASLINNIKAVFDYETRFEEKINYGLSYHVVLVSRIYDRYDSKNILYENKDVIVDKTDFVINSTISKLNIDVNIDYKKYNDFALDYINKYSPNSEASLDAILYIEENEETRRVASLNIPLVKKEFKVVSNLVENDEYLATVTLKEWDDKDTGILIVSAVLVLFAVLLMISFTKLIMGSITKKSAYEVLLQDILNTYDRLIVVARDGYESDIVMKTVKVSSFEELLDAREILNKPIIYTKINSVKSEFIVEDENKIYKYVMKEADIK